MLHEVAKRIAIRLMKLWEAFPDENNLALQEVFNQRRYTSGTPDEQRNLRLKSSQYRWDYEEEICFFNKFFPQ